MVNYSNNIIVFFEKKVTKTKTKKLVETWYLVSTTLYPGRLTKTYFCELYSSQSFRLELVVLASFWHCTVQYASYSLSWDVLSDTRVPQRCIPASHLMQIA